MTCFCVWEPARAFIQPDSLYAWSFAHRTSLCLSCGSGIWEPPELLSLLNIINDITTGIHTTDFMTILMRFRCTMRNAFQQLLTSKLDPPQDEEDQDGDEDYGDTCTNYHPHHLNKEEPKRENISGIHYSIYNSKAFIYLDILILK